MIGPQAYENLFYHPSISWSSSDMEIKYKGVLYTYYERYTRPSSDGAWELFDTRGHFKAWCIEDIMERQGEYADKKELIV